MKEEENILNNQEEVNNFLQGLSKGMPYKVPAAYFESLNKNILNKIQQEEETAAIAPLLNSIGKQMPFAIPENYFETVSFKPVVEIKGKVIRLQIWKQVMAAAVIIGLMLTTISIWNVQRKADFSVAIKQVKTEDLVNQLDTSSGIIYTNADTDSDDTSVAIEVSEPQEDLQLASDEDLQEYINENIDNQFNYNNTDI